MRLTMLWFDEGTANTATPKRLVAIISLMTRQQEVVHQNQRFSFRGLNCGAIVPVVTG
jgi:hypothetical protein